MDGQIPGVMAGGVKFCAGVAKGLSYVLLCHEITQVMRFTPYDFPIPTFFPTICSKGAVYRESNKITKIPLLSVSSTTAVFSLLLHCLI